MVPCISRVVVLVVLDSSSKDGETGQDVGLS